LIQVTAQTRVLVAVAPADFRRGIDGLARVCRSALSVDPFSGAVFVFRNRRGTSVKVLAYDGQGFWLCQKRLSRGKFRYWPTSIESAAMPLLAHELSVLLSAGDPRGTRAAPLWRRVDGAAETR